MITIAAVLAFILGAMSIVAGGKVMQGWQPGWLILNWLPVYNFIMGLVTVFVPTILIWKNSPYAIPAALATLGIHAIVLILLVTVFCETTAVQSIFAMIARLAVWVAILALLFRSLKNG